MTTHSNLPLVRPEAETAKRILDIFFLGDGSSSMTGPPNAILNQATRECLNEIKTEAKQHPEVEFRFRCIAFASNAWWLIGPDPVSIENVIWKELPANGGTSTGAAIEKLAEAVTEDKMPEQGLAPVMVLLSDGGNTDGQAYDRAIDKLDKLLWGAKAIRLSIGVGNYFNRAQLEKFTNHPEVGVLEAKSAVDLANYIRYATVTASIAASQNQSDPGNVSTNVTLPPPPKQVEASASNIMLSAR